MSNARAIREQLDRESVREWQERHGEPRVRLCGPVNTVDHETLIYAARVVRLLGRPAYVSVS